jgi:hypothetical protein
LGVLDEQNVGYREQNDAYIAFVSIPFENNLAPLKCIAEELISRGYRASFSSPNVKHQWLDSVPGLEYISTGPPPVIPDDVVKNRYKVSSRIS